MGGQNGVSMLQVCQHSQDTDYAWAVANGPEEMWIDDDGKPYLYYIGRLR